MVAIHRQRRRARAADVLALGGRADQAATSHAAADGAGYAALSLAVRLNSFPGLANQIRQSPVPPGMLVVIRVASGCTQTRADAVAATGFDERFLVSAATLLVSLFLGDSRGDPRRILCVGPQAPTEEVRDHMKWLLKWLHPDRNGQASVSTMAGRVIGAWGQVKASKINVESALGGPAADGASATSQKRSRSKWRAVPLSVRRAQLEAAAGIDKLRRDVAAELTDLRNLDRPSPDDV